MKGPTSLLFLTMRDVVTKGQPHTVAEVEVLEGVADKLKSFRSEGGRVVLLADWPEIAEGKIDESTVTRIMAEVSRMCANQFDRILWCSHSTKVATQEERECFCRMPRAGLVYSAIFSLSGQYEGEYYRPWTITIVSKERGAAQLADEQWFMCYTHDKWMSKV